MRVRVHKDARKAVMAALRAGCTLEKKNPHYKIHFPDGRSLTMPGTPGDRHSIKNFVSNLEGMMNGKESRRIR